MSGRAHGWLLLTAAFALSGPTAAAPLPYDLWIEVAHGGERSAESFRAELEFALREELSVSDCYRSIRAEPAPSAPDDDDLVFRVVVDELEERTEWDVTLARRSQPNGDPTVARRQTARAEARVDGRIETATDLLTLRSRRWVETRVYRPILDEDTRLEARARLVETLARQLRSYACGTSAKKLGRLVTRARASAAR